MTTSGIAITPCNTPSIFKHEGYIIMCQEHCYCDLKSVLKSYENKKENTDKFKHIQVVYIALMNEEEEPLYPFCCLN